MSAILIDGKAVAAQITSEIAAETEKMERKPGLAVVLVGEDPASTIYVRNKERACKRSGIRSRVIRLSEDTEQARLLDIVAELNADADIDGILVQMPIPKQIDTPTVIEAIDPRKDVDGIHPLNAGALMSGRKGFVPCTPRGCVDLLKRSGVPLSGARAVVIGRSQIVGKPISLLLLNENCTVTMCHSKTRDIGEITRQADVLIAALGRPRFVTADMIKPGAAVIDVGVNRLADGKLAGDVDFEAAKEIAGWITPVPGGVGPMTIAMLMRNTLEAAVNGR